MFLGPPISIHYGGISSLLHPNSVISCSIGSPALSLQPSRLIPTIEWQWRFHQRTPGGHGIVRFHLFLLLAVWSDKWFGRIELVDYRLWNTGLFGCWRCTSKARVKNAHCRFYFCVLHIWKLKYYSFSLVFLNILVLNKKHSHSANLRRT